MENNTFRMTYQEVENTVSQLTRYADAIREELDRVTIASSNVTADEWRGKAAESYKNTFDTLRPKFDLFYNQIMECVNYLNTAMGKNQAADTQVSGTFAE